MLLHEAMQETGFSKKALQYYEEKDLIKPKRLENGYREYDDTCIRRLTEIAMLKKLGFEIQEIKAIMNEDYHDDIYASALHQIDAKTTLLQQQKEQIKQLRTKASLDAVDLDTDAVYPYFYTSKLHLMYGMINMVILVLLTILWMWLKFPAMPTMIIPFGTIVFCELQAEHYTLHRTRPYLDHVAFSLHHVTYIAWISCLRNLMLISMIQTAIMMQHKLFLGLSVLWCLYSIVLCFLPIWNRKDHG